MSSQRPLRKHPPAMTDVAALAGVSHQTVSRVLNNTGKVKVETRERVLKAIAELGYRRNEAARALVTRRSNLIGIITATFTHVGPASTLLSVQLAAKEQGYYVTVATLSEFTPENLREALDLFLGQGVVGIVVIAPVVEVARQLEDFSVPVPMVAISSSWTTASTAIIRVGVDQRCGTRQAVEHLLDQGCRSIAHFAGPEIWFDARGRESAWREILEERGIEPGRLFCGDWSAASGYLMAQELIAAGLPDGLFSGNDQMALGAMRAFAEAGISVPEDIKVVGFDDEEGSAYFYPSLTTVRQDFSGIGTGAVKALIACISGEVPADQSISPQLIVRASA